MFQHVVNTVDVNTLKIIAEMIQSKNPIIQERRVNQATNHAENPVNTKRPKILKKRPSEKADWLIPSRTPRGQRPSIR